MISWVIGRSGLLGRAVVAAMQDSAGREWIPDESVPWHDEEASVARLAAFARSFVEVVTEARSPWRIFWCAGAGVVATSASALEAETRVVRAVLDALGSEIDRAPEIRAWGAVFLASSAGGVYGGSPVRPPYSESSPTGAASPYGREKLAQEAFAVLFAERHGIPVLIGRISNLYGPGQDLLKPQGLITQVGRAALRRVPLPIYVPLDTVRDYLYTADAGGLIVRSIERLEQEVGNTEVTGARVKIIASEVPTTVASVLRAWRQTLRRAPRIALASSPVGLLQPRVLTFRSTVWPDLAIQPTPLQNGVHAVMQEELVRICAG